MKSEDLFPFLYPISPPHVSVLSDSEGSVAVERNVSLKQVLQHMESSPDITGYGLCGLRKWSSKGTRLGQHEEPFSCGHLHDFVLLNVDVTRDVQYNQNR